MTEQRDLVDDGGQSENIKRTKEVKRKINQNKTGSLRNNNPSEMVADSTFSWAQHKKEPTETTKIMKTKCNSQSTQTKLVHRNRKSELMSNDLETASSKEARTGIAAWIHRMCDQTAMYDTSGYLVKLVKDTGKSWVQHGTSKADSKAQRYSRNMIMTKVVDIAMCWHEGKNEKEGWFDVPKENNGANHTSDRIGHTTPNLVIEIRELISGNNANKDQYNKMKVFGSMEQSTSSTNRCINQEEIPSDGNVHRGNDIVNPGTGVTTGTTNVSTCHNDGQGGDRSPVLLSEVVKHDVRSSDINRSQDLPDLPQGNAHHIDVTYDSLIGSNESSRSPATNHRSVVLTIESTKPSSDKLAKTHHHGECKTNGSKSRKQDTKTTGQKAKCNENTAKLVNISYNEDTAKSANISKAMSNKPYKHRMYGSVLRHNGGHSIKTKTYFVSARATTLVTLHERPETTTGPDTGMYEANVKEDDGSHKIQM